MGIFYPHQLLGPSRGMSRHPAAEHRLHFLIHLLRLAVELVMETRGQACGGPDEAADFLPEYRGELGTSIPDHIRWKKCAAELVLVNPPDSGSPLTKPDDIWDQVRCDTGRGCR